MAKLELSFDYKKIGHSILEFLGRYKVIITSLVILVLFGYALVRIDQLSNPQANQDRLTEQLGTYRKVKIDNETVDSVKELDESNVEVETQFDNRDNPFAE